MPNPRFQFGRLRSSIYTSYCVHDTVTDRCYRSSVPLEAVLTEEDLRCFASQAAFTLKQLLADPNSTWTPLELVQDKHP